MLLERSEDHVVAWKPKLFQVKTSSEQPKSIYHVLKLVQTCGYTLLCMIHKMTWWEHLHASTCALCHFVLLLQHKQVLIQLQSIQNSECYLYRCLTRTKCQHIQMFNLPASSTVKMLHITHDIRRENRIIVNNCNTTLELNVFEAANIFVDRFPEKC